MAAGQLAEVFPRDAWDKWGAPRPTIHLISPLTRVEVAPPSRDRSYLWLFSPEGNVHFFPSDAAPGILPGATPTVDMMQFGFPDHGLASTLGWSAFNSDNVGSFFACVIEQFKIPSLGCVCDERDTEFQVLQEVIRRYNNKTSV